MAGSEPPSGVVAGILKEEGDLLFRESKYVEAIAKYTEALRVGGDNAILYSNRSLCRFKLRQFLHAQADAHKAIELDPTFAKAHGRLAEAQGALKEPGLSKQSYNRALENLPKTGLTPSEANLKISWILSREAADIMCKSRQSHLEERIDELRALQGNGKELPWVISAKRALPRLRRKKDNSSTAWTLARASDDLAQGIHAYKRTSALTLISNAILIDNRVFKVQDLLVVNAVIRQCRSLCKAWPDYSAPDSIQSEAHRLLEVNGENAWDTVRPALDVTVRIWICYAFFRETFDEEISASEYFTWAIELIIRGREQWSEVKKEVKGEIFELTFLNCVKKLSMAMHQAVLKSPDKAKVLAAVQKATDFISELDAQRTPDRDSDPALAAASYYHAKGEALRVVSFHHWLKGEGTRAWLEQELMSKIELQVLWRYGSPKREDYQDFIIASKSYVKLANCYGEDDENHSIFLAYAIHLMERTPFTARPELQIPLMRRIKDAAPKMEKIWKRSHLGQQRRDHFVDGMLKFYELLRSLGYDH